MITYEYDVPVEEFFKKEGGILSEHWKEIATNKEKIVLNPDVDKYKLLQEVGVLSNIVAYKDGEMAGYSVIFSQPHIHYMDDVYSYVDVIYVSNKFRNSRIGISLINETEKAAKQKGASVVMYHTKPEHNAIEKILMKKGYKHIENNFGKCLKE